MATFFQENIIFLMSVIFLSGLIAFSSEMQQEYETEFLAHFDASIISAGDEKVTVAPLHRQAVQTETVSTAPSEIISSSSSSTNSRIRFKSHDDEEDDDDDD